MKGKSFFIFFIRLILFNYLILLCSCSTFRSTSTANNDSPQPPRTIAPLPSTNYALRIPDNINTSEKTVVVDPRVHVWGAYNSNGTLVRSGLASAGSNWCNDLGRPCHTRSGTFRVFSLGGPTCKSHIFPMPHGGAPMPYCMFFHGGQALHGVPEYEIGEGNFSHGCVRLRVSDAEWLRYNFINVGTKVIVRQY